MNKLKCFVTFLLAIFLSIACVACSNSRVKPNGPSTNDDPDDPSSASYINANVYNSLSEEYRFDTSYIAQNRTKFSGTLYMARAYGDELTGWEYVYDAYEKMYPNVTIKSSEYSSGNSMAQALITQMSTGTESIGLVQGNYVQDQLKQYGYNFQGGFTESVNPYASPENEEILVGDLLDDYTVNNLRAERITFQNTTTCFFVNTTALAEVGMTVSDIQTWDDIIEACRLLKAAGYTAPFGIGGNNDSLTSKDFKWMYRIYLDQYYMDLIDDIQFQYGDYNYNKLTAESFDFNFDRNDFEQDANYSVNPMRAYNLLLNEDADNPYYVGAKSAKFRCFLNNLAKIAPYVSSGFATNGITEIQQSFLRGGKNEAVFMVNYTGFGIALENYSNSGGINFDWACFDYVPMVCSCTDVACNDENGNHICNHVDNAETEDQCTLHVHTTKTRDEGGVGGFIGLYTEGKTAEEVELYLDFLRFFMSPYGQSLFYEGLANNFGWPKAVSVIDGAVMPESWSNFAEYSKDITFNGLCVNWFTDFLVGCSNASGQQYSLCKTAIAQNLPKGNVDSIVTVFNTQIQLYASDNLSQYAADCYKNYTQKPVSR